jgi:hypothetical protein
MLRKLLILLLGAGVLLWLGASYLFRKKTPEEKLTSLQKEVAPKGGEVFRTTLKGKPVAFLLIDCELFLLDPTKEDGVGRTKVLQPGFYPWFKACTGQSIKVEGKYVMVYLANRAIGAGGGNTSGGMYRSEDGLTWEKETSKGWKPVEEAQA